LQRLEVFIAVMLARERRWPVDTTADGYTEFAAALAALPSGLLEMVADALVALDRADA
jgi:predicted component of type VI protein secretion system